MSGPFWAQNRVGPDDVKQQPEDRSPKRALVATTRDLNLITTVVESLVLKSLESCELIYRILQSSSS